MGNAALSGAAAGQDAGGERCPADTLFGPGTPPDAQNSHNYQRCRCHGPLHAGPRSTLPACQRWQPRRPPGAPAIGHSDVFRH